MQASAPQQATIRVTTAGEVLTAQLVDVTGRVLCSATAPKPHCIGPRRFDLGPFYKVRAKLVRYAIKHGIDIISPE